MTAAERARLIAALLRAGHDDTEIASIMRDAGQPVELRDLRPRPCKRSGCPVIVLPGERFCWKHEP